jgi:carboxyl-terminal processing protease
MNAGNASTGWSGTPVLGPVIAALSCAPPESSLPHSTVGGSMAMRPGVSDRPAWYLSLLLAGLIPLVTWASPPDATPAPAASVPAAPAVVADSLAEADACLQQALELERRRSWSEAIKVYERAVEQWPDRPEFNLRKRLCEAHYRLGRRYQDQSFRKVLLQLPRDKALALYEEVLERIDLNYVDPVPFEPLVRRGYDNMEVALRDPSFLKLNQVAAGADRVLRLRQALSARRASLTVGNRQAALDQLVTVCDLAQQAIGLKAAPVALEFAYGACDALDDYTSYLTPDKLDDLYAMIDGNFVGLGIELKLDTEGLRLVGVIRGGPAWEAGLKVGDQIVRVAGQSVRGLSLDEAASRLQGAEGSAVEISVLRADGSNRNFNLVRRHVEVESVSQSRIVDRAAGVGYIQLTGFQKTSTEELDRAIAGLKRQGMRILVLDLRGNPGGLLNVAVEIAERFVEQGVIVSTRGRAPGQSQVYVSQAKAVWSIPLYVLIDHDSASASEILAGALKDHSRATLVGERSYGKGSVQSIFALRTAPAGLKLTTAKFYSPRNRPYSEQGVEPDLPVRVALKPAGSDEHGRSQRASADPVTEFGDPAHDPVLGQAILHAKRRLNAAR